MKSNWGLVAGIVCGHWAGLSVAGVLWSGGLFGYLWFRKVRGRSELIFDPLGFAYRCLGFFLVVFLYAFVYAVCGEYTKAVYLGFFRSVLHEGLPFLALWFVVGVIYGRAGDIFDNIGRWYLGAYRFSRGELADFLRLSLVRLFFVSIYWGFAANRFAMSVPLALTPRGVFAWVSHWVFVVDIGIALAAYLFGGRLFGYRQTVADWRVFGWVVCLACYPPFNGVLSTSFPYEDGRFIWEYVGPGPGAWVVCSLLVMATVLYGWASVALGFSFGNLVTKGVVCDWGPYRYFAHPAYLGKNLFWWLETVPFLGDRPLLHVAALAAVTGVYWLRARAESSMLVASLPGYRRYLVTLRQRRHALARGVAGVALAFLRRCFGWGVRPRVTAPVLDRGRRYRLGTVRKSAGSRRPRCVPGTMRL